MKMKKGRRLISMLMVLAVAISAPATRVHADSTVNRIGQSKVGSVTQAYTGGNSQVYAHVITRADGTKVRYVYSKNYLIADGLEDTLSVLKSVLTAEFAALIPDNADEGVGFFFCSDPSLERYVNDNWTSAEYVARNILTVPQEGASYTYASEGNGAGGAVNTTATAARKNNRFEWIKALAEAGNYAKWQAIEAERKRSWDAAEAAHHENDPSYTPQVYQPGTYTPLDFGDLTVDDIQGTRDITNSQIDLAVGCSFSTSYDFEHGRFVEVPDITIVDHVATVYSDHVTISESLAEEEEPQAATVKEGPKPKSLTYTGSAQELVTAGEATGGRMQYALGTDATTAPTEYTTSIPTGINPGTYYVWYKVVGNADHTDADPSCVEAKIEPQKETEYTVTFKVINGAWDDGTTEDITVTLKGFEGDSLKLARADIPAAGTRPADKYQEGEWDTVPDTEKEITKDTGYTYTYKAVPEQEQEPVAEPEPEPDPEPATESEPAPEPMDPTYAVYRFFNPATGDHFFTANENEKEALIGSGWNYEGIAWRTSGSDGAPVYRLFDAGRTGIHVFSAGAAEKDEYLAKGWVYEGIAFFSDETKSRPVHKLTDTETGLIHYTAVSAEIEALVTKGWKDEGTEFFVK